MKFKSALTVLAISLITMACNEDVTDLGSAIQPAGDRIEVYAATIPLTTENVFIGSIYSRPDSFLLGSFYDHAKFGTTNGDILAQVKQPINHTYPPEYSPDSVKLFLYYKRWFGDRLSPMNIKVYEMNKGTFNYSQLYKTDINLADYTDKSILLGEKTFTAVDATSERDSTYIGIKLSNDFLQRFSSIDPKTYNSNQEFLDQFKGFYITTDFGSGTMLYVTSIIMEYYYSYTYTTPGILQTDSIVTVKTVVPFPANDEVRQINRIEHPDYEEVKEKLNQNIEFNYICSPGKVYTRVNIPLAHIKEKMNVGDKKLVINSGLLKVDITDLNYADYPLPMVSNMLLVKESEADEFFRRRKLPSDTLAIRTSYLGKANEETNEIEYYYSFDIAKLVANEIKKAEKNKTNLPENMSFLLVPVKLRYDGNNNLIEVQPQYLMSSSTIFSGQNSTRPMKINMVWSGF